MAHKTDNWYSAVRTEFGAVTKKPLVGASTDGWNADEAIGNPVGVGVVNDHSVFLRTRKSKWTEVSAGKCYRMARFYTWGQWLLSQLGMEALASNWTVVCPPQSSGGGSQIRAALGAFPEMRRPANYDLTVQVSNSYTMTTVGVLGRCPFSFEEMGHWNDAVPAWHRDAQKMVKVAAHCLYLAEQEQGDDDREFALRTYGSDCMDVRAPRTKTWAAISAHWERRVAARFRALVEERNLVEQQTANAVVAGTVTGMAYV